MASTDPAAGLTPASVLRSAGALRPVGWCRQCPPSWSLWERRRPSQGRCRENAISRGRFRATPAGTPRPWSFPPSARGRRGDGAAVLLQSPSCAPCRAATVPQSCMPPSCPASITSRLPTVTRRLPGSGDALLQSRVRALRQAYGGVATGPRTAPRFGKRATDHKIASAQLPEQYRASPAHYPRVTTGWPHPTPCQLRVDATTWPAWPLPSDSVTLVSYGSLTGPRPTNTPAQ